MKKFLYLLLFVSSLSIAQSKEIIEKPANNTYFVLNKTTSFELKIISFLISISCLMKVEEPIIIHHI